MERRFPFSSIEKIKLFKVSRWTLKKKAIELCETFLEKRMNKTNTFSKWTSALDFSSFRRREPDIPQPDYVLYAQSTTWYQWYQKHNQVQTKNLNSVLTSKSLKVTFILQEQTITIVKINDTTVLLSCAADSDESVIYWGVTTHICRTHCAWLVLWS